MTTEGNVTKGSIPYPMYYIVIDCNTRGTASEAAGSRFPGSWDLYYNRTQYRAREYVLQYHTRQGEYVLQYITFKRLFDSSSVKRKNEG
jgi:hypothetical protein